MYINPAIEFKNGTVICYKNTKEKYIHLYLSIGITSNIETKINAVQFKLRLYNDFSNYWFNINNKNINSHYVWCTYKNIKNIEFYNKYEIQKNDDNMIVLPKEDMTKIDNKKIIISSNYIKPKGWSLKWNHNTNKGGYIRIKCDILIISSNDGINATGMGYYGNNEYNKGKGKKYHSWPGYVTKGLGYDGGNIYGNKELDILYHGSGCMDKNEGIGGGIIDIQCNTLLNFGDIISNGYKRGSGGSIFINARSFINHGYVMALSSFLNNQCVGRMAFYCDELINYGCITPIPFRASFKDGLNIIKNRKNI